MNVAKFRHLFSRKAWQLFVIIEVIRNVKLLWNVRILQLQAKYGCPLRDEEYAGFWYDWRNTISGIIYLKRSVKIINDFPSQLQILCWLTGRYSLQFEGAVPFISKAETICLMLTEQRWASGGHQLSSVLNSDWWLILNQEYVPRSPSKIRSVNQSLSWHI